MLAHPRRIEPDGFREAHELHRLAVFLGERAIRAGGELSGEQADAEAQGHARDATWLGAFGTRRV